MDTYDSFQDPRQVSITQEGVTVQHTVTRPEVKVRPNYTKTHGITGEGNHDVIRFDTIDLNSLLINGVSHSIDRTDRANRYQVPYVAPTFILDNTDIFAAYSNVDLGSDNTTEENVLINILPLTLMVQQGGWDIAGGGRNSGTGTVGSTNDAGTVAQLDSPSDITRFWLNSKYDDNGTLRDLGRQVPQTVSNKVTFNIDATVTGVVHARCVDAAGTEIYQVDGYKVVTTGDNAYTFTNLGGIFFGDLNVEFELAAGASITINGLTVGCEDFYYYYTLTNAIEMVRRSSDSAHLPINGETLGVSGSSYVANWLGTDDGYCSARYDQATAVDNHDLVPESGGVNQPKTAEAGVMKAWTKVGSLHNTFGLRSVNVSHADHIGESSHTVFIVMDLSTLVNPQGVLYITDLDATTVAQAYLGIGSGLTGGNASLYIISREGGNTPSFVQSYTSASPPSGSSLITVQFDRTLHVARTYVNGVLEGTTALASGVSYKSIDTPRIIFGGHNDSDPYPCDARMSGLLLAKTINSTIISDIETDLMALYGI